MTLTFELYNLDTRLTALPRPIKWSVKAKFHYATWFEPVCDQLRTSFEPDSVMEFGFKYENWLMMGAVQRKEA